jgi:hypothetical protein
MLGTKRNSSGSLATIFKRELPSTSAALEDGASFPTPVGFAAQENNPLPAATIEHDALRAIDVMFFGQGNRIALHTRLPCMALSVCTFWVAGCTTGFSLPQVPIVGGRAHRLYHLSLLFMTYLRGFGNTFLPKSRSRKLRVLGAQEESRGCRTSALFFATARLSWPFGASA